MIYKLGDKIPKLGDNNYISPSATVIGNVITGDSVSVWPSAVLRGDCCTITIGDKSNIQDNSTVHGGPHHNVTIGSQVTVGHNCVIHGCTIGDNVLIGMNSVILSGAVIPSNSLVAAGSVVASTFKCEVGSLIVGNPAKAIKPLPEKYYQYITSSVEEYLHEIEEYKKLELIK